MSLGTAVQELCRVLFVIFYNYITAFISLIYPPPKKSIEGEIVLITGAGHGIGREFALEISRLGAIVVLWDINKENNEKTAKDVEAAGGKAYAYVCDITSSAHISDTAEKVRADVGEVSMLINNAGIINCGPFLELSEGDIRRTFEVNTLSHFWTVKEFLPSMIKKNHGHIVSVISMAGFFGTHMMTDYSASKFGAMGFFEALMDELAKEGRTNIKMTALCPMFVNTGLVKNYELARGRTLEPKEVVLAAIDGILRDYELVTVPQSLNLTLRINNLFPRKTVKFLKLNSGITVRSQYKKQS